VSRALLAFALALALAAPADAAVSVSVDRARIATGLGDKFRFASTVTNAGTAPVSGLVAHLNVVSERRDVYVDPEDWSSQRVHYLPTLRPGQSVRTGWRGEAVNGGEFALYVVVLPQAGALTVSPAVRMHVTEHRTLNSDGVLPLVVGIPLALTLLAGAMRLHRAKRPG
jgi:hypothetical protein